MKRTLSLALFAGVLTSATATSAGEPSLSEPARLFDSKESSKALPWPFGKLVPRTVSHEDEVPPDSVLGVPKEAAGPPMVLPPWTRGARGMPLRPFPEREIVLYPHVRYKDRHNAHPRAVPQIVSVLDPRHHPRFGPPNYVPVQIWVPPYVRPKVKVKDHGRKLEFDFGKYEIEIESKKGYVEVDYDD